MGDRRCGAESYKGDGLAVRLDNGARTGRGGASRQPRKIKADGVILAVVSLEQDALLPATVFPVRVLVVGALLLDEEDPLVPANEDALRDLPVAYVRH